MKKKTILDEVVFILFFKLASLSELFMTETW
jgi:hypothetical protein